MSKKAIRDAVEALNDLLDTNPEEVQSLLETYRAQPVAVTPLELLNTALAAATGGRKVAVAYDDEGHINAFTEKRDTAPRKVKVEPDDEKAPDPEPFS